ncbi:MAG: PHP domain-containing protein [Chloroflexi bacterium]|nr:PHP domain-containing protein [Chloroflexota bacterium]MBI3931755.1 PHP domain-containing protein [Chloroflexota bacterium]
MLKADFHIHTAYSMDCATSLEEIISRCLETGINCIAVADHDSIEGALKIQSLSPFPVIVAEEILTPHGEIMGMFLQERIPSGLPIEQAIAHIKSQDALVCLPHPFDTLRGLRLDGNRVEALAEQIDIIEVFNARCLLPRPSTKARAFARKYDIPGTAGSDAHSPDEIGSTYVEMPEFNGRDDFLRALRQGKISRHRSSPLVHFSSTWTKLKKSF